MVESRLLIDSTSFGSAADAWAHESGLFDENGDLIVPFPAILGVPDGSPDLGAFNIGIILANRTIKLALQDLETSVSARMLASTNLSDLPNKVTARSNLGLGSAATWNVGTSGAVVPLLNTINTWTGKQNFTGSINSTNNVEVTAPAGQQANVFLMTGSSARWGVLRDGATESGSNAGSNFYISRYADNGAWIDNPLNIVRSTGVVNLSQPLPVASGGTGTNSLTTLKTTMGLNNVDNTSDVNKPVSTATTTALNNKLNLSGGTLTGILNVVADNQAVFKTSTGTNPSAIHRNDGSNYYILLSDPLAGPTATWNAKRPFIIDVNTGQLKSQNGQGFQGGMTVDNGLSVASGGLTVINNGVTINAYGGSEYNGVTLRNTYGNSSRQSVNYIDMYNEVGMITTSFYGVNKADGSGVFSWYGTPAGSRTVDRRSWMMELNTSGLQMNVPINGRAYARRSDGADLNFYWSGQGGQPSWLWGGSDGNNMYVYNPSNFSVSYAGNAGQLNGLGGGNQGSYIRRSTDANTNGNWSRQLVLTGGSAQDEIWSAPLEIREINQVSNSNTSTPYAPGIVFHWSNVTASAIKLFGDGSFRFQAQGGVATNYRPIYASEHYATGWYRCLNDAGVYWDNRGRGINVADSGATYGNITTWGNGLNGWAGYSVGNYITMMGSSGDKGLHSPAYGDWLLRFDSNQDAWFPKNITAYSDERLKQNKRPISDVTGRREGMARAAIMYERDNETRIGFGAQTLELVVPEVVKTADDLIGTKSVNYSDMVAILAVDNDNLSKRIDELELEKINLSNKLVEVLARLDAAGL